MVSKKLIFLFLIVDISTNFVLDQVDGLELC